MPNKTRICMLVTRSTLERFSGALVEFWDGGQVNENIFKWCWVKFYWVVMWGGKKCMCSVFLIQNYKTLGLPASVWSRGQCRQQFPQPTVCSWAGHHAITPGLDPEERDWGQQERHEATNRDVLFNPYVIQLLLLQQAASFKTQTTKSNITLKKKIQMVLCLTSGSQAAVCLWSHTSVCLGLRTPNDLRGSSSRPRSGRQLWVVDPEKFIKSRKEETRQERSTKQNRLNANKTGS